MKLDPWSYAEKGTEHSEQVALFSWCNMAANFGVNAANNERSYNEKGFAQFVSNNCNDLIPNLSRLFAIHNQGHGDAIRGARARAEGVKTGVPDLCLPVVMFDTGELIFAGLYIELKTRERKGAGVRKAEIVTKRAGTASDKQKDWIEFLRNQGYCCEVSYGWEEARDLILHYLGK